MSPHLGRSALDALELMNMGVNYLREHTPPHTRMHYPCSMPRIAPNVVQAHAKGRYMIRAVDPADVREILGRLKDIAQGAALMTGQRHSQIVSGMSNQIMNAPLSQVLHENFMRLGPPPFDDADRDFAAKICETLRPATSTRLSNGRPARGARQGSLRFHHAAGQQWRLWHGRIERCRRCELYRADGVGAGATCAIGTLFHTWQCTAQGKTAVAHKEWFTRPRRWRAPRSMCSAIRFWWTQARADLVKQTGGRPYEFPVPKDVPAPIEIADETCAREA